MDNNYNNYNFFYEHYKGQVEEWLNNNNNNDDEPYHYLLESYKITDFEKYYNENDTDVKASLDPKFEDLDDFIEDYGKRKILFRPKSNRYHANMLFKKIIDHPSNKLLNGRIINKNFKDKFYAYCYENSKKI